MLSLIIHNIQQLTPSIRSYELRNTNGQDLPLIAAGAHLKIAIALDNGTNKLQQYSICSDPSQRDTYAIAIQQNSNGNNAAYNNFRTGLILQCESPGNRFQLHADTSPALFIAEGIGIAAIKPMAYTLSRRGRRFQVHHAASSVTEMVFHDELSSKLGQYYFTYPADQEKTWDIKHLLSTSAHNTLFYVSGSRALIDNIYQIAFSLGISKDRIHSEAVASQASENDKSIVLELMRSHKLIHVSENQSLLAAIRDAGVMADFDCCVGECGTCAVKMIDGEADHRDSILSEAARTEGMICICVSRAHSEKLVLDL